MSKGWIKLHRKLIDNPLYQKMTAAQRDVLIQIFLMANHEEKEWYWKGKMYKCRPGQFITSLNSLKKRCARDVSIQTIRTVLTNTQANKQLTHESTKEGTLVTICNWDTYQGSENETNTQANTQLTQYLTTNKNKEVRKKNIPYAQIVDLYNANCVNLVRCIELNDTRKTKIRQRWLEHPDLDWWKGYFTRANSSNFLSGKVEGKKFRAGLDFLLSPEKMTRLLEGTYDNKDVVIKPTQSIGVSLWCPIHDDLGYKGQPGSDCKRDGCGKPTITKAEYRKLQQDNRVENANLSSLLGG